MEQHTRNLTAAIGYCLAVIVLLLMVIFVLVLTKPAKRQIQGQPAFERATDKAVFQRLLAKHGLKHEISIIYEDHLGRYFIRGGKRCAFR